VDLTTGAGVAAYLVSLYGQAWAFMLPVFGVSLSLGLISKLIYDFSVGVLLSRRVS